MLCRIGNMYGKTLTHMFYILGLIKRRQLLFALSSGLVVEKMQRPGRP